MVLKRLLSLLVATIWLLSAVSFGQDTQADPGQRKQDSLLIRGSHELNDVPLKLQALFDRGNKLHNEGHISLAAKSFGQYISSLREHLALMFVLMAGSDKEAYLSNYLDQVAHILKYALAFANQHAPLGALAYDCELLTKGLMLESSNRLKSAILHSGNKQYIEWMNATEELKQLYAQLRGHYDVLEADSTYLTALKIVREGGSHVLSKEIEKAEKGYRSMNEIAEKIAEFEKEMSLRVSLHERPLSSLTVSWRDVQHVLSNRQAAIEFVARQLTSDSPEIIYYAILVRRDIDYPIVIPLFLEEAISTIIQTDKPDFSLLFDKVWRPVGWHLEDIQEVFLATSGLLNGLPFAALQYKGHYLTEYCYLRNVLSTRDAIRLKQEAWDNKPISEFALFFGGADFGISPLKNVNGTSTRDGSNEADIYRGQGFDYLPQSKTEVEVSAELLSKMGWKSSLFTDVSASKHNLIQSVALESPSLLHIATHGFYFPKRSSAIADLQMSDIGSVAKSQYIFSQNPLMRCGLLFSGANYIWNGKEPAVDTDNGILTGEELSGLNLSKTELAIVSACHTAWGDIDYAEGVRGIQRALRLAGAKKTIVALWEIPDKESAEFMREFYTFLRVSRNVISSFRHAQQYMQRKYSAHPKKWAGFVLIE